MKLHFRRKLNDVIHKMSCLNHRPIDPRRERSCMDNQCPNFCFPSSTCPAAYRNHRSDVCRSGSYSERMAPEYKKTSVSGTEVCREGRGDPPFPDMNMQMGRVPEAYAQTRLVSPKHRESFSSLSVEKVHARLKVLEDGNIVLQSRTQNLVTENNGLRSLLHEEAAKKDELEKTIAYLQRECEKTKRELLSERQKFAEHLINREQKVNTRSAKDSETSSSDFVKTSERGVQMWAVCKGCQRKLESCEKEPPTVTITKSELEILEKDMQVLRDAVIAREEAWDKAMEREQTYRQQIARLNSEAITERHISKSHLEKLNDVTDTLTDKESEVRTIQKEAQYLNKLIAKLALRLRNTKEQSTVAAGFEMNDRDQKTIDEIVRRLTTAKNKQKGKSKSACSERTPNAAEQQHASPRGGKDSKLIGKDQLGSS